MSADNWAQCPRCSRLGNTRLEKRAAEVRALYGIVPVEEFGRLQEELESQLQEFQARRPTFREDYEIYGTKDGTVVVCYGGSCFACGLSLDFEDRHEIKGCDDEA